MERSTSQHYLQKACWLENWAIYVFKIADELELVGNMSDRERFVNVGNRWLRESENLLMLATKFERIGK